MSVDRTPTDIPLKPKQQTVAIATDHVALAEPMKMRDANWLVQPIIIRWRSFRWKKRFERKERTRTPINLEIKGIICTLIPREV